MRKFGKFMVAAGLTLSAGIVDAKADHIDAVELHCVSLGVYYEARNQPLAGQIAVAYTILNRAIHNRFPGTACAVIKQNRRGKKLNKCQFSFYCDGKTENPRDKVAFYAAQNIAYAVAHAITQEPTGDKGKPCIGPLWYHKIGKKPIWRIKLTKACVIGDHIFYNLQKDWNK